MDVSLKPGGVEEVVNVTENASVLNTTTAEVSTRFDEKRLSELPVATNRNVLNVLLSVPGVSQLGAGQTGFTSGAQFSANGGRTRSNNFLLDGQDVNNSSVAGATIALNNPDAIQEVRIITNQFLPEFGRNSGSVVNVIGKSGTNNFHGSVFWFHNNKKLNSCSNTEKASGYCNPNATDPAKKLAPFRLENQVGFTFGGPLHLPAFGEGGPYIINGKDRTFFFGDYQRWTDRQLGAGATINGAPTAEGKAILQAQAGSRPQVAALLKFLPAGAANGTSKTVTINGNSYVIPLGNLTGTSSIRFNDNQGSFRIDHQINSKNFIYGRYRFADQITTGGGQISPEGLSTVASSKSKAATIVLNSVLSNKISNEFRVAYQRYEENTSAADSSSESIPSLEVTDLGLSGFNAAASRTAIGLAVNLPQFSTRNTYQIQDNLTYSTGNHNFKFGVDFRYWQQKSFFYPSVRGRLAYSTLQNLINDNADVASNVNRPLAGGDLIQFYTWFEVFTYAQDEWRITPNFKLTYGVRYEYPGDSFDYLKKLNERIVAANGNDQRYVFTPQPKVDLNNFMPRIGFNWNPRTRDTGILGFVTGGDKLVFRGGYAKTYDASFLNIHLNVATASPFVASVNLPATGAFVAMQNFTSPAGLNPLLLNRTVVSEDFRAPSTDQFSFEMQRELTKDMVFKATYIGTRGTGLFQTIDGNPRTRCTGGTSANPCPRVDPTRGVIRLRANTASSIYHALQTSIDKRLSRNFSAGLHYTWSAFIDTASEIFNPSTAEIAVSQDSFNIAADRSRSSYDKPHRLTGNVVFELPFFKEQQGFTGHVLGGWQLNSFFTFQNGTPFTVLNGSDPAGALNGIDSLVGNAIRPNINTNLDLSRMSIEEIRAAGGAGLFSTITAAQRVGNAGRNILRSDDIASIDFGIIKNTKITESVRFQLRADFFNVINHRNFGIPNATVTAGANFLNQWSTNGGNRRVIVGGRLVF